MTADEMIVLFGERYNLSSNSNDDKLDDEIYLYLNAAQNRLIKQRFTGFVTGFGFQSTQKRIDDLRTLLTQTNSLAASLDSIPEIPNGKRYDVPSNFLFFVKAFCQISGSWFSCEMITMEESYKWIETPDNIPLVREAKVLYENNSTFTIIVDPDRFAGLTNAKMQYIRQPLEINDINDSDLPEHTHEEIVEIAVGLAVEGIENIERFQTHTEKLKTVE